MFLQLYFLPDDWGHLTINNCMFLMISMLHSSLLFSGVFCESISVSNLCLIFKAYDHYILWSSMIMYDLWLFWAAKPIAVDQLVWLEGDYRGCFKPFTDTECTFMSKILWALMIPWSAQDMVTTDLRFPRVMKQSHFDRGPPSKGRWFLDTNIVWLQSKLISLCECSYTCIIASLISQ